MGKNSKGRSSSKSEAKPPSGERAGSNKRACGSNGKFLDVRIAAVGDGSEFQGRIIQLRRNATMMMSHSDYVARLEGVFTRASCQAIIECAEAHGDWKEQADSVDGKAEWQHTIVDFSRRFSTQSLGALVETLATAVVLPALQVAFGLEPHLLYMHWAFVRAYAPSRRLNFPVHRDSSVATANILLSDPNSFSGAELYVLGPAFTGVDKLSDKEFKKRLPEGALRREHAAMYQQGDCVMHLGKRMHGVLPILSGTRHTLILMFYERREAL